MIDRRLRRCARLGPVYATSAALRCVIMNIETINCSAGQTHPIELYRIAHGKVVCS